MKKYIILAAGCMIFAAFPANAGKDEKKNAEPQLTEEQIRSLQVRDFPASRDILFTSTVSVLQADGYRNINASKDAGTISGETDAKSKLIYNIFWGFGKKKLTQLASIFIEDRGPDNSRVRIKYSTTESKARMGGVSYSDGEPVMIASPYTDFFAALAAEVSGRKAELAGSAAPITDTPPVVPVSSSN